MKDIKQLLKEAREAIKNKNFETSLKLCRLILKEEKTNYMALIFTGVSFQESGQLPKAYTAFQEAIKLNPTNPLGWNGLINYYEKLDTSETKPDLLKSYINMIEIETQEKKLVEYVHKISNLIDYGNVSEIVTSFYKLFKSGKCADNTEIAVALANLLSKEKSLSEWAPIYEETLKYLVSNKNTVCIKYFSEYLNILYKSNKKEDVYKNAQKMHALFESDWTSLKWMCKMFNESYVEQNLMIDQEENISSFSDQLLKCEQQSPTALFTKSVLLVENNKLVEAKDILCEVVNKLPGLLHAWILLLKCYVKLHLFVEAIQVANKVESLLQSGNGAKHGLRKVVEVYMLEALSRSFEESDLKIALTLYENMDNDAKESFRVHIIRAHINLCNFTEAQALLEDLKQSNEHEITHDLLLAKLLQKQNKYEEALELLKKRDVDLSEWWLLIGVLYWESQQYQESLIPFLKAAKLDPNNYNCFLYLGHYYKKNADLDKARKCYEKSFKINTGSSDAGIELSKIYRKMKKWDANLTLLQALTRRVINKNNSWAWMQLGLHHLEQQNYDEAIANLRFVVRIEADNINCWESLADAYLAKGAFTSALRCYEKASLLNENSLYPLLQKATIKKMLGEFTSAKTDFENVLKLDDCHIPTLKEISETCILQAKECLQEQRLGTSRDHIQCAVNYLTKALRKRGDLACLWKLLGDSCVLVSKLPEKFCCLLISKSFIEETEEDGNIGLEKDDVLSLAERAYYKSITLTEDNILLWHDLAACYLLHFCYAKNEELAKKAQAIAEFCTSKNSAHWQHWNLLGNVAMCVDPPNFRMAQHCFIKAVTAENNSAVSWSNLGVLYLIIGDFKLSNEAFSRAQRADPNYVSSWIGQAFLAECFGHEDAMDLFRHSTQLSFHRQGALGYASWVCKTLKESPLDAVVYSIHNMHAIPIACDGILWYIEHSPDDGTAWNMLGVLQERLGLKLGALKAFKNAFVLSKGGFRDKARINYGRLLDRNERHGEAIDIFSEVEVATFSSCSQLALSLFKSKRYKESYETYESTLHWLSDEPHYQSELLVALASMAYMFEGAEAAKTLLFQSVQVETPSPWGFFATLAVGLLHKDAHMAELVLNEVKQFKNDKQCAAHIAILSAYFYLLQKNLKSAIREVSSMIHRHPDEAAIWLFLSSLLIRTHSENSITNVASKCALIAIKLGQINTDLKKAPSLLSISLMLNGDNHGALLMAQKAVHYYPNLAEGWVIFATALSNMKKMKNSYVIDILEHTLQLSSSNVFNDWIKKTTRLLS